MVGKFDFIDLNRCSPFISIKPYKGWPSLRAIAENPDAATMMGIDVDRIVPIVFILIGFLRYLHPFLQ